jgi:DNA polymerase-1
MSLRSRFVLGDAPLFLMDGSAFIFRSFYAYRNMTRSDGFPTNALYMVARQVLKILREERPAAFGFIMDGKGVNFRHERFPAYKAQRSATPEPLVMQLAPLQELLGVLGLPVIVSEGCEADDCIASLAVRFRDTCKVVILGADKDLKQCLHPNVLLWDPAAKDEKITTLRQFEEETGMAPSSWPDYQALVGDSSDNIPGVPKIGAKTAIGLIQEFKTLEELFDRLPAVPPKIRPKLEGQRESAMLYRELTRLRVDVCPSVDKAALTLRLPDIEAALAVMARYELHSLAREVASMDRAGVFAPGPSDSSSPAATRGEEKSPAGSPTPRASAVFSPSQAGGMTAGTASGPQPVPGPPTRPETRSAVQGALLTDAPIPEFVPASSADALPLPDASGCPDADAAPVLALVPLASGLLVAAGAEERLYTGDMDSLALRLAAWQSALPRPPVLVAPDSKALGKSYPALGLFAAESPLSLLSVKRPAPWFDLALAAYLLSPEDRGYSFAQIGTRWAEPSGSPHSPGKRPGLLALDLYRFMAGQLAGAGLDHVFTCLELPLAPVLAKMEERGITVDRAAFTDFLDETQGDLDRLTAHIHTLAGRVFNIRSSQQLSDVLFSLLGLPKSGKTKGGAMSTSQEVLEKLHGRHPIIEALLEYRKLEKLRSTYLEPLPRLADADNRIHTTFNQTATATGRLSSSNPNLQNIPVRGPLGMRMRACFIAAPGKSLVCADYSQIELRVLAHLSEDPTLLDAFRNNEDIHSRTAGLLFDLPLDQVTPDMRRNAKTINFGLIYGMGAQKLAQELSIRLEEAKDFIKRYFSRLTRLKEFYDAIEEEARAQGYVVTMTGRRRLTPDILSRNTQIRSQARRQAINTRIQGSAADIIKLAMLAVENDQELHRLEARLLLQIHDELLLEVPADAAEAAGQRLAELMTGVNPGSAPFRVPLLVDWGIGGTWADAH